jgi:hypothetical protein
MLETYNADTEQFLNDLPTREKYAMLALAIMINQGYDDYEEGYDEATRKVSAQGLTEYLMKFPWLWCHLQNVVQIVERRGWDAFDVVWVSHDEGEGSED